MHDKVAPSPELAQTPVSATLVHRAGMCSLPADRRRWAGYSAGGRRVSLRRPDVEAAVLGYHEVFHLLVIAGVAAHFLAISLLALLTGWTRPVVDRAAEGGCLRLLVGATRLGFGVDDPVRPPRDLNLGGHNAGWPPLPGASGCSIPSRSRPTVATRPPVARPQIEPSPRAIARLGGML